MTRLLLLINDSAAEWTLTVSFNRNICSRKYVNKKWMINYHSHNNRAKPLLKQNMNC